MHMNREPYGVGAAMDSVYNELNLLQCRYLEYLEQESLSSQITVLKHLIEDFRQGDSGAEESLREHGSDLLKAVKERLEAAVAEEERMLDESPSVASRSNGEKTHDISRAAALLADAEEKLGISLQEELPH